MKRSWKKTLAACLAVAMLLSVCVIPVAAEGTTTTDTTTVIVGDEGENAKSTIAEALAVDGVKTIQLNKNVTEDVVIESGVTVTLDLNGFTLTNNASHTIFNKGNLTIIDSKGNAEASGTVDNVTHAKAALWNEPGATAHLQSGKYIRSLENGQSDTNNGGNSFYNILNHGSMTIEDGVTVEQNGSYSSLVENGWYDGNAKGAGEASMTINGGLFSGGIKTIKNDDYGILEINGGIFTNFTQAAFLNWNVATVNGGTFDCDAQAVILNGYLNDTMDKGELTITGGTFTAKEGSDAIAQMGGSTSIGTIKISGGTFSSDVKEFVKSGYSITQNSDGTYKVYYFVDDTPSTPSTPPSTSNTETKTEGDVTTTTTTTEKTNTDGSKTTQTTQTQTNAATGEKTETTTSETVAKDGSVTKEETKTATTADGVKTEETVITNVDKTTGTTATATVKTDETGSSTATVVVEAKDDASQAAVPAATVKAAAKADAVTMTVKMADAEISLDADAVAAVANTAGEKVIISAETVKVETLPAAAQTALTGAKVVDLSIQSGSTKVSDFGGGNVAVTLAYSKADHSNAVAVYYVAVNGNMTRVSGAVYNAAAGTVTFTTDHFSYYAVKEEAPLPFSDVKDSNWFYDAVRYVYEQKLFGGTSDTTFSPNALMTREMLATVLYRQAGQPDSSGMVLGEFADGESVSEWAKPAMRWAVHEGILTGTGSKLDPQGAVTREQLAVILYRMAKTPAVSGNLSKFADGADVSSWASSAMVWAVEEGLLQGSAGKLNPTNTATRAEVATILQRNSEA